MAPAPKPRADLFWVKPRVWIKAQHVLPPSCLRGTGCDSRQRNLVTAGGGQGPETGRIRRVAARGISHLGHFFSVPRILPGRQSKERRKAEGPKFRDLQQLFPAPWEATPRPPGSHSHPDMQKMLRYLLKPQPQGNGVTRVFTKALGCHGVGACLSHPAQSRLRSYPQGGGGWGKYA